jgi:hypothetical protein
MENLIHTLMPKEGTDNEIKATDGGSYTRKSRGSKSSFVKNLLEKAKHIKPLDWTNLLHIDMSNVPDGIEACWIRSRIAGKPDEENMALSFREGWEPAPIEFHPERCSRDAKGELLFKDPNATYRDVILCYRAKELGDRERNSYANHTKEVTNNLNVADIPFKVNDQRRVNMHFRQGNPHKHVGD